MVLPELAVDHEPDNRGEHPHGTPQRALGDEVDMRPTVHRGQPPGPVDGLGTFDDVGLQPRWALEPRELHHLLELFTSRDLGPLADAVSRTGRPVREYLHPGLRRLPGPEVLGPLSIGDRT